MGLIAYIISWAVELYIYLIIAQVAVHWLMTFNIINPANMNARRLVMLMERATDPLYRPLRRIIPPIGGFDLTPIVLIMGLSILRSILISILI